MFYRPAFQRRRFVSSSKFIEIRFDSLLKPTGKAGRVERIEGMKKILIIDSREDSIELLETTLERDDRMLLKTDTGENALKIAQAEKLNLLILNVPLPGKLNGQETIRVLKGLPGTRECKIIVICGTDLEPDRRAGLTAGAFDYFMKPFSPLKLIHRVDELLWD